MKSNRSRGPKAGVLLAGAALVLVAGTGAAAWVLHQAPAHTGAGMSVLRLSAPGLDQAVPNLAPLAIPNPTPVRMASHVVKNVPAARPARVATYAFHAPVLPPVDGATVPLDLSSKSAAKVAAAAPAAPVDPFRSLSLLGITAINGAPTVWVRNTQSREEQRATVGGSLFGFQVAQIGAESVLLRQGSRSRELSFQYRWHGDAPIAGVASVEDPAGSREAAAIPEP